MTSKRILVKSRQMPDTFFLGSCDGPYHRPVGMRAWQVLGALFA